MNAHPLSRGFEWQRPPGVGNRLDPDCIEAYDRDGFFLLESVFDPATIRAVAAETDRFEAEVTDKLREREDGKLFIARADEITFAAHLVMRSSVLRDFCSSSPFRDLAHDLIGPDVRLYWDQSVYKKPGTEAEFPWHQDNGYTFIEPQQYLTCWVALTDADERNGCPRVAPGVHRHGTRRHRLTDLGYLCFEEESPGALSVPVRAGGVVVFSSLTPHSTGPNLTDSVRKSYIVQFAPDGAVRVTLDDKGRRIETPAAHPERQFLILEDGARPRG